MDEDVARTCAAYLEMADRRAPGLVEGLYLQGSIALADYCPGVSDIDFVAVTSRTPDPDIIRAIHRDLRRCRPRRPYVDGLYTRWTDLSRDPTECPAGPSVHEWRVEPASRFERHLVTWHVLAQGGVAIRGAAVGEIGIFTDWPALAVATECNLRDYWTPWRDRKARGLLGLTPWAVSWGVLGAARLRHTLAAGRVTSKTEAAAYALDTYCDRWHRLIQEALRIRVGGPRLYRDPWRRRADLLGFLSDALAR
ncbi:aminoglycoside adenylyltransferase domain-containing protein [Cryptosporangium minutisporangium]|uniref:Adenylyltransferase AadA C-terminal domain-containing protein n=1 Tax=Cryptosporangium minutisporangium TaxID=113569 RepID=A0ABP6T2D0_9ACTN